MRDYTRVLSRLTLVFLIAGVMGSCGISTERSPQIIQRSTIPFGLMNTIPTATEPTEITQNPLEVFYVSSNRLIAISRPLNGHLDLQQEISALLAGPTSQEAFIGITTDIPAGTSIRQVKQTQGTLTVDLSGNFAFINGQSQIFAIAQIVYSLTQIPGINSLIFELNGVATDVPTESGTLVSGPVSRLDYFQLAQAPPTTASPPTQAPPTTASPPTQTPFTRGF